MTRIAPRIARFAAFSVLGALLAIGSIRAQSVSDRLLLSAAGPTGGVFALDVASGRLTTVAAGSYGAVHVAPFGRGADIVGVTTGSSPRMNWFTDAGAAVCRMSVGGGAALALDQTGELISLDSCNRLFRVGGAVPTTFTTLSGVQAATAIARDGDRGDFVAGSWDGSLLAIDRASGAMTTIARGLGKITGVAWLPRTGGFAISRYHATHGLLLLDAAGAVVRALAFRVATAVTIDEKRDRLFVANAAGDVAEYTTAGTAGRVFALGSARRWTGIDVARDCNVQLATQGPTAAIHIRFDDSPGRACFVALSMTPRPIVGLGGNRMLNMSVDPLFRATMAGALTGMTDRFVGVTDANGYASATLRLPAAMPPGTRIYFGAIAANPRLTNGVDVGNVATLKRG